MAQNNLPTLVAIIARKSDNLEEGVEGLVKVVTKQGMKLDAHCMASIPMAHPRPAQGMSASISTEDDVSEDAPKEGTIFFKGKVSGKWFLAALLIVITVGATYGVTKLIGG